MEKKERYYPKHKWKSNGTGKCKICDLLAYQVNEDDVCRICYSKAKKKGVNTNNSKKEKEE